MTRTRCWARSLGDCRGAISREHTISASLFSASKLLVHGLPWCRGEPKTVSVKSLVANRLCEGHNNALSEADAEAKRLFAILDAAAHLDEERRAIPPPLWWSNIVTHRVSGRLLERWLLKTVINMTVGGRLPIGVDVTEPGVVDRDLVAIAFGRAEFLAPMGFYGGALVGETLDGSREWSFQLLGAERVTGVLARLRTVRFGLSLIRHRLPHVIEHVDEWRGTHLLQPFNGFDRKLGPYLSQRIVFDW